MKENVSSLGSRVNIFSSLGATVVLSLDCLKMLKLDIPDSDNVFVGNDMTPLWRLWLFDEETKKLNTYPECPDAKQYWQDMLVMGSNSISSLESVLVAKKWNKEKGILKLEFSHEYADVSMFFQFSESGVIWWGEFNNKGPQPVYRFETIPGWELSYSDTNSFLMPEYTMSAIEYKPVYETEYTMHCTWDGFIVTAHEKLTGLYAIQDSGHFMPTHTRLKGDGHKTGTVAVNSSTICFRKSGEGLSSVKNKLASFKNLREWGDSYIYDNFGKLKKLKEKLSKDIYDKLSSAVMIPIAGDMRQAAEVINQIPGTAIIHTPGYMSPTDGSPVTWDSFPNYFPPNKLYGTSVDYQQLVERIHDCGHLFMPRNSFFYWTRGSEVDKKYDLENLAIIRLDGKPRTANWCLPGYLVSPSSNVAINLLEEFYKKWLKTGADIYFTNVIAAIDPCGNGYDFHPDSPAPDLFFDQIRKMMIKYGSRMPLLSEGGAAWQLPFQTGLCLHPAWNPDSPGAGYWRTPGRGNYLGYRNEVGVFLKNEYIRFYPHNTGTRLGQSSIGQLSFSILNSLNPKLGIASADRFTRRNKRWLEMLSHLGKTVFSRLFGARLLSYEYNDTGQIFAEYESASIIANFSEQDYDCSDVLPECQIAPNGFLFMSNDLLAGNLSIFKGKVCSQWEIIIVENNVEVRYDTLSEKRKSHCSKQNMSEENSELIIKIRLSMNSFPQFGNSQGAVPIITPPENAGGNTLELRYNMHYGTIQFLQKYSDYLICDLTAYDLELEPETWYDIVVSTGQAPRLFINDRVFDNPAWYYVHEQVPLKGAPASTETWKFEAKSDSWKVSDDKSFNVSFVDVV